MRIRGVGGNLRQGPAAIDPRGQTAFNGTFLHGLVCVENTSGILLGLLVDSQPATCD